MQDQSTGSQSAGATAYMDGYHWGDSYWPTAKNDGLSYAGECSNQSGNAPSGDDVSRWEAGCIAAGQADVSDYNR
jgi:hypothetical protein